MKNEEAWAYVRKTADWYGAIDPEVVAQDALVKNWGKDLSKGYWATCGRNGARRQYRDEQKHIKLREFYISSPEMAVYSDDSFIDSRFLLADLYNAEPAAFTTVLHYVNSDKTKHTNIEYKRAEHARWKLRAALARFTQT